jgi:hypothetical protein
MSLDRTKLSKLIELLQRPQERRLRLIEQDAKKSVYKQRHETKSEDRDFYIPFWSDAKQSVIDEDFDLDQATADRIDANPLRRRMYEKLLSGFDAIWTEVSSRLALSAIKRSKTPTIKACESGDAFARVDNVLCVTGGADTVIIYPYFSKDVPLGGRHASLAIAAIQRAIPEPANCNVCFADVVRGRIYFDSDITWTGRELDELDVRYDAVMLEWRNQRRLHSRS